MVRDNRDDRDDLDRATIDRTDLIENPRNVDAENGIFACILLDNAVMEEVSARLESADDFFDHRNRAQFIAYQAIYERGEQIDFISIFEELQRTGKWDDAGGLYATRGELLTLVPTSWPAAHYAEIVAGHARKREANDRWRQATAAILQPGVSATQSAAAVLELFQPFADKLAENTTENDAIISAADLMRMEIPEMNWPIAHILPEGLAIIGAPPKTGKSAIALQLALSITTGGKALGTASVHQGDVLYLALEDSRARMRSRIECQMCGEQPPGNLDIRFVSPPMLEGGLIQIESWLRTHPDAQAVFIDTIGRFRGVGSQNENGNIFAADYQDMAKLQTLALKHHVAIVALHHLRKDRAGADPLESLSGTTGMTAPADAVWVISRERNQEMGELQVIGRDVQEQSIAVKLSQLTLTWQAMGAAEDVALKEGQRHVFEALRSIAHGATPSEIAFATGEKLGTIKTRCFRMKEEGLLISLDKGRYWFGKQRPGGF